MGMGWFEGCMTERYFWVPMATRFPRALEVTYWARPLACLARRAEE